MAAASVWSYRLCGIAVDDERVVRGLDWLASDYSVVSNDGSGSQSDYYYAYTLAKAMILSNKLMAWEIVTRWVTRNDYTLKPTENPAGESGAEEKNTFHKELIS